MSILDKIKGLFKKETREVQDVDEVKKDENVVVDSDIAKKLDEEQKIIDKLYIEQGGGEPSDEVLEMQVALNEKRTTYNLPDKRNLVNGDFVQ